MTTKSKTREVTVTTSSEGALALMSDDERRLLLAMSEKIFSDLEVRFKDGKPIPAKGKSEDLPYAVILEICKTGSVNGAMQTVNNAAAGQYWNESDTNLAVAYAQIADLEPQTPLEAMLISQMVAVNTAIGKVMYRAMLKDQTAYGKEFNANFATKLQRTFVAQIEALQKLRGKGGQKVTVKHVHVHEGGQAIVGNVNHTPRAGGEGKDGK